MLALYLVAAHLVGDFVLQTRWQASGKFGGGVTAFDLRTKHVLGYCLPFVPVAIVFSPDAWHAADFMVLLYALHFLTDTRRFRSTLGDVVGWWFASPESRSRQVGEARGRIYEFPPYYAYPPVDVERKLPLPPSPWAPLPICIDQTLHVCQLALLGGIFLS
jgi:hypothetical protein